MLRTSARGLPIPGEREENGNEVSKNEGVLALRGAGRGMSRHQEWYDDIYPYPLHFLFAMGFPCLTLNSDRHREDDE